MKYEKPGLVKEVELKGDKEEKGKKAKLVAMILLDRRKEEEVDYTGCKGEPGSNSLNVLTKLSV